jgi:hypothetical protein
MIMCNETQEANQIKRTMFIFVPLIARQKYSYAISSWRSKGKNFYKYHYYLWISKSIMQNYNMIMSIHYLKNYCRIVYEVLYFQIVLPP